MFKGKNGIWQGVEGQAGCDGLLLWRSGFKMLGCNSLWAWWSVYSPLVLIMIIDEVYTIPRPFLVITSRRSRLVGLSKRDAARSPEETCGQPRLHTSPCHDLLPISGST